MLKYLGLHQTGKLGSQLDICWQGKFTFLYLAVNKADRARILGGTWIIRRYSWMKKSKKWGPYKSTLIAALFLYCARGPAIEERRNRKINILIFYCGFFYCDHITAAAAIVYCDFAAIEDAAIDFLSSGFVYCGIFYCDVAIDDYCGSRNSPNL